MSEAERDRATEEQAREQGERDDPATPVPPAPPDKEPFFERRRRERGARRLAKESAKAREKEERDRKPEPDTVMPAAAAQAARTASPPLAAPLSTTPNRDPDHDAIREAAEREALARLAEAERRSDAEREHEVEPVSTEAQEHIERARLESHQRAPEAAQGATSELAEDRQSSELPSVAPSSGPKREVLLAELQEAESKLTQNREQEEELARELARTEERFAESKRLTDDALERAAARLNEIEARAVAAERRAEQAETLASEKGEEVKRTDRLREMLDRIAEAEQRASAAEQRARIAVDRVTEPTPELDEAAAVLDRPSAAEAEPEAPDAEPEAPLSTEPEAQPDTDPVPPAAAAPEWFSTTLEPEQATELTDPGAGATRAPDDALSDPGEAQALLDVATSSVAINTASYEELRALGLSVTQTGRLLAQRERNGSFQSLDELDGIPGFPQSFLDQLKRKLTL